MKVAARLPDNLRFISARRGAGGVLSPVEALVPAWHSTLHLLFQPFNRRRWIALSLICIFLGGGTSTAGFQWGFSALPLDLRGAEIIARIRLVVAEHISLIVLSIALSAMVIVAILYIRCVLRFVLVDAIVRREVTLRAAWKQLEPRGRAYFIWFMELLGLLLVALCFAGFVSFRFFGWIRDAGYPQWIASAILVSELVAVIAAGLLVAIAITLTDDLVVPMIYAEKSSFRSAWTTIGKMIRHDFGTFLFYLILRFLAGIAIGIAVLFVLFPVLMGLSSAAIVIAALVLFGLHVFGLAWVWNPITFIVGALALSLFSSVLFALLSIVGMPGQVYLQDYGVRFMASRIPKLSDLCRAGLVSSEAQ